jgi:hemoglobin-like flavoprotein
VELVWTLEKGLGEESADEVCAAWFATYQALAGVMMSEADGLQSAA